MLQMLEIRGHSAMQYPYTCYSWNLGNHRLSMVIGAFKRSRVISGMWEVIGNVGVINNYSSMLIHYVSIHAFHVWCVEDEYFSMQFCYDSSATGLIRPSMRLKLEFCLSMMCSLKSNLIQSFFIVLAFKTCI